MKMILIVLSALLALVGSAQAANTVTVLETTTVISSASNDLVVYKTTEAMRVSHVPEGISADDAYSLVTGKLKEVVVRGKKTRAAQLSFSSPLEIVSSPTIYADTVFTYEGGVWSSREVERSEKWGDTFDNTLFLWGAAFFVATTILATRRVFAVPAAMLVGLLGTVAGQPWFAVVLCGVIILTMEDFERGLIFSLGLLYMLFSAIWLLLFTIMGATGNLSDAFVTHYIVIIITVGIVTHLLKAAFIHAKSDPNGVYRFGPATR